MPTSVELEVTDEFHRAKRSVMLYSGLVVIVSLATVNATEIKLSTFSDLALPVGVTKLLLWLLAGYYFIQFYAEFTTVRARNSQMLSRQNDVLRQRLANVADQFSDATDKLSASLKKLTDVIGEELERWQSAASHEKAQMGTIVSAVQIQLEEMKEGTLQAIANQYPGAAVPSVALQRFDNAIGTMQAAAEGAVGEFSSAAQSTYYLKSQIDVIMEQARSRLHGIEAAAANIYKLDRNLSRRQKTHLWAWEFGGGMVMFLLATLFLVEALTGFPPMHKAFNRIEQITDAPRSRQTPLREPSTRTNTKAQSVVSPHGS